jgi:hypothetical protein
MSEDLIDEMFSAIDQYYPGSKRKRKPVKEEKVKVVVEKTWDSRPYVKTLPNGTDVELFTLGALAQALGRPIVTARTWDMLGYIPNAPYRLPDVIDKNGDVRKGRKLYSRAMVDAAVELFDKQGLLGLDRIEWSEIQQVPQQLAEVWEHIKKQETTNNAEKAETEK